MPIVHDPEQAELSAIRTLLPSFAGARVLEIGCGDGRLTRRYAAAAAAVTALDPDADAIDQYRRDLTAANVSLYAIDFDQFIGPPGGYDVVILSWSF